MTDNNSIQTPYQGSEVKAYIVSDSIANKQIIIGYTMLAVGIILLVLIHNLIGILSSCVYLYVAYWQKNRKAIILFDTYIEFKIAPAGLKKQIRYTDITKVENISDKKMIIHPSDGKRARVPVALLTHEDRRDFLNRLNEAISV
ncbi:MAG: hypothetical protein N4A37_11170 [Prolixibacteraceae bacterium]|jgi:hypothetical protein|nr:hypothetical protein [Prolixibacteraceae bacterium]